jgi:Flp pilus assembly protein TadG
MKIFLAGRRFARSERGAILALVALTIPLLLGFTGLAVDVGLRWSQQEAMQIAADTASLNAVTAIVDNQSARATNCPVEIAMAAAVGGFVNNVNNTTISYTGCSSGNYVTVTITRNITFPFIKSFINLFGGSFPANGWQTGATATSRSQILNLYCSLSLGDINYSTSLSGSTSWTSNTCGLADNSTQTCGLYTSGSADITAPVSAAGGACGVRVSGLDLLYSRPVEDPYASLQVELGTNYPSGSGQTINPKSAQGSGSQTLPSGHYASIPNKATLNLASGGVYYFDTVDNPANGTTVTGTGATIIFKDTATFPNNMPTFNISPPTTGTFKGVSIASLSSSAFTLLGGNSISGTIYFPNASLSFSGNTTQACLQFIGYTVTFTGSSNLVNDTANCPFFSGNQVKRRVLQVIN